jgi:phage tail P2-like protein|nr:MAG TPA: tail protein [Caudoviricetes sp.]
MNDLYKFKLKDTLPSSIANDANVQALAEVVTLKLMALMPFVDRLTILSHLNELSTPILDELAWHLHVDFYNEAATREQKIKLILSSIAWHRRKGTVGLVEEAIGGLYSECEVVENWDYEDGKPYHFKLQMSGYMMTPNIRERVLRILEFVKNKRSWLDGIEYVHAINSGGVYVGGIATAAGSAVAEPSLKIAIGPQTQQLYVGGVITVHQFIHI